MNSNIEVTLLNYAGKPLNPLPYDQYKSVVTIGDGTTTATFGVGPITITSVGGVSVSASPTGVLSTPDAIISAQQTNPVPVVVSCVNLPSVYSVSVFVRPANASDVSRFPGGNRTGTALFSTATILINIPRGGGLIYATATIEP